MAAREYSVIVLCVALAGASALARFGDAKAAAIAGDAKTAPVAMAGMAVSRQAGVVESVGHALDFYYSNPVTRRLRTVNQQLEFLYKPIRTAYRGRIPGAVEHVEGDFRFSLVTPKGKAPEGGWPYALFAPGILGVGRQYEAFAREMASRGLAVALYDIPRLTEYDPVVRRRWAVESEAVLRRSPLPLDHDKFIGVGHSGGSALMVGGRDKLRARGLVGVAAGWPEHADAVVREGLRAKGQAPVLSIGFGADVTAPAAEFAQALVTSPKDRYVEIPGAQHNDLHNALGPVNLDVVSKVTDEVIAFAKRVGVLPN